jgi:hypothetical protein
LGPTLRSGPLPVLSAEVGLPSASDSNETVVLDSGLSRNEVDSPAPGVGFAGHVLGKGLQVGRRVIELVPAGAAFPL